MPRTRLIKSIIDALPTPDKEIVYWDESLPGFGLKITPKGRKVFIVLYRAGGSGSRLRKYTIGPYGRVTLHNARLEAQKVLAARLEGRDPATEKREARRRITVDTVTEIVALYTKQHLSKRRSGRELTRICSASLSSAGAPGRFTRSPSVTSSTSSQPSSTAVLQWLRTRRSR